MPIVNELTTLLNYKVDTSGLGAANRAVNAVGAGVRGVGAWFGRLGRTINDTIVAGAKEGYQDWKRLNDEQRKTVGNVRQIGEGYNSLGLYIRSLVAGIGLLSTARLADEWAGVESRIALAVNDSELKPTLKALYDISQASAQSYLATADLFSTVARNQKELALTTEDSLKLTDVIGKAMALGGGSAESQKAALVQLGQALGSGVLRGDELNSILEQAPRLATAVADAFGVSVGQLRNLGSQGKLTSKDLAQGLLKQAEKINAEAARLPKTFGRGFTLIENSWGRFVNNINKASRASEYFYRVSQYIADNMEEIAQLGAFVGITAALTALRPIAWATVAPFVRMAALLGGLYLLGEDFLGWLNGDISVFGKLFGERAVWQHEIDAVKGFITWLKQALDDNTSSVEQFVLKWGAIATVGYAILRVVGVLLRGLWLLAGPVGWLLRVFWSVGVILAGLLGWPGLLAAAIAGLVYVVYENFDKIKKYVNETWDGVVKYFTELWTGAIDKIAEMAKRLLPEKFFLSQKEASDLRAKTGDALNPYKDFMPSPGSTAATIQQGARATVMSAPGGTNNVTNNVTINTPSSNPDALGATAADAVGRATTRSLPSLPMPTVEAAP